MKRHSPGGLSYFLRPAVPKILFSETRQTLRNRLDGKIVNLDGVVVSTPSGVLNRQVDVDRRSRRDVHGGSQSARGVEGVVDDRPGDRLEAGVAAGVARQVVV